MILHKSNQNCVPCREMWQLSQLSDGLEAIYASMLWCFFTRIPTVSERQMTVQIHNVKYILLQSTLALSWPPKQRITPPKSTLFRDVTRCIPVQAGYFIIKLLLNNRVHNSILHFKLWTSITMADFSTLHTDSQLCWSIHLFTLAQVHTVIIHFSRHTKNYFCWNFKTITTCLESISVLLNMIIHLLMLVVPFHALQCLVIPQVSTAVSTFWRNTLYILLWKI